MVAIGWLILGTALGLALGRMMSLGRAVSPPSTSRRSERAPRAARSELRTAVPFRPRIPPAPPPSLDHFDHDAETRDLT